MLPRLFNSNLLLRIPDNGTVEDSDSSPFDEQMLAVAPFSEAVHPKSCTAFDQNPV